MGEAEQKEGQVERRSSVMMARSQINFPKSQTDLTCWYCGWLIDSSMCACIVFFRAKICASRRFCSCSISEERRRRWNRSERRDKVSEGILTSPSYTNARQSDSNHSLATSDSTFSKTRRKPGPASLSLSARTGSSLLGSTFSKNLIEVRRVSKMS